MAHENHAHRPIVHPVLFIGGGNMASAIIDGALRAGVLPEAPIVVEPDEARRARHPAGVVDLNAGLARLDQRERETGRPGFTVLAVKPQVFPIVSDTARALGTDPVGDRLVVSVMAGVRTGTIRERLAPSGRVIRVMPNTPAAIGQAMSAVAPDTRATNEDIGLAERLMASAGRVLRIDESRMDVFTGLAGSGPAYLFRFAEAMIQAGQRHGLERDDAVRAAVQTVAGAGALLAAAYEEGTGTAESLRVAVTSPGGTTAAGLAVLDEAGLIDIVTDAVGAAAARGAELAGS